MPPQGSARLRRRQKWQRVVVSVMPHIADLGSLFIAELGDEYETMMSGGLRVPLPAGEYDVRYESAVVLGKHRVLAGLALFRRGASMGSLDPTPIGRVRSRTGKMLLVDGARKPNGYAHAATMLVAAASRAYPWPTHTPWAPFGRRGVVMTTGFEPGAYDVWVARDRQGAIGMVLMDFTVSDDEPVLVRPDDQMP